MPSHTRFAAVVVMTVAVTPMTAPAQQAGQNPYQKQVTDWREKRDTGLRQPDGWLTLVGLFWLAQGDATIGSAPDNSFVLPASAPAHVGRFELRSGRVSFRAAPASDVRLGGARVTDRQLKDDRESSPDVLTFGTYSMLVISRGAKFGVRVRDTQSDRLRHFPGERWFPVKEGWRLTGRWVAYDKPRVVKIPSVIGEEYDMPSPGYVVLTIAGREVKLEPVLEEPDAKELFYIFKDGTSGHETYPAGRFLYSDFPQNGRVTLDFNKAYNPPCAFSPFATCPLPPPQNRITARIEAGALNYEH
jgi:uncharacterized protein (DUF1684 family)